MKDSAIAVWRRVSLLRTGAVEKINASSDRAVLGWISLCYFVWRTITLPCFEVSGDAVWKWSFLRYFHETGVWFPQFTDHHQGRWGQNIPVYLLMEAFDSAAPWIGALVPAFTGLALLVLVWLITRLFATRAGALTAVLLTAANPVFIDESAQFLPSMPSTMYIMLTLYLVMRYIINCRSWFLPLLAGMTLGLAWGCKVTAAYWALGIGIFLIFFPVGEDGENSGKKFRIGRDVLLGVLGFLLIFIPETLIINHCFDVKLGRIDMLHGHHGDNQNLVQFNLLEYIFSPLVIFLDAGGKFVRSSIKCLLFLLAVPVAIMQLRQKATPPARRFLILAMLVAMACHCYMVVNVFPFKHPERPLARYFFALYCVWNIVIVWSWRSIIDISREKFKGVLMPVYCAGCVFLAAMLLCNMVNEQIIKGDNLFAKIRIYRYMEQHRRDGLPVLVRYAKGRVFQTRTCKLIVAYETFFGKTETLPELHKQQEVFALREPVQSAKGDLYFLLWGKRPAPDSSCRCIVIDRDGVDMQEIKFKKYRKPVVNSRN